MDTGLQPKKGLSKSRIIAHLQCPKRLWLQTYKSELAKQDASSVRMMEAGTRAGEIARDMFPGGTLIDTSNFAQAIEETRQLLNSEKKRNRPVNPSSQ